MADKLLTPQQEQFLSFYTDPKSETFSNAVQSALKAGYEETYANNITGLMPDWLGKRKLYQVDRFFKAVNRLEKLSLESDKGKFVYILKSQEYYKIGITSNLERRVNSIQGGNPFEVEVVCAYRVKDSRTLEKYLHEGLLAFRHKREWFKLEPDFVEELKVFIENYDKP
jgi:hypothetical protein